MRSSRTGAGVLEIVSPGDESWAKLQFYAVHDVDDVRIIDPYERTFCSTAAPLKGDVTSGR